MISKKTYVLFSLVSLLLVSFVSYALDEVDRVTGSTGPCGFSSSDACSLSRIVGKCSPLSSLGADGWASTNGGTTGGDGAEESQVFVVRDRAGLVAAMGDAANAVKKIIYVCGTIDLCVDDSNLPLTEADFIATVNGVTYGFADYVAAYDPAVWGRKAIPATDPQEAARKQSQVNQKARIVVPVSPNTSIIGIGRRAKIVNGSLMIKGVDNVVIRNIEFSDSYDMFPAWDPLDSYDAATDTGGRWNSQYDLVSVESSTHVWIDHCTFNDGERPDETDAGSLVFGQIYQHHDACIDVTKQSNYVTISWNYFHNHDKVTLAGSSDTATAANGYGYLSVTYHHNLFKDVKQRMPRVRFGMVHAYNNVFIGKVDEASLYSFSYAFGIGKFARLYCENNTFLVKDAAVSNLYSLMHKADSKISDSTYFYDSGTILNGKAVDVYADAAAKAIEDGKPPLVQTNTIWSPSTSYDYSLDEGWRMFLLVRLSSGAGAKIRMAGNCR